MYIHSMSRNILAIYTYLSAKKISFFNDQENCNHSSSSQIKYKENSFLLNFRYAHKVSLLIYRSKICHVQKFLHCAIVKTILVMFKGKQK